MFGFKRREKKANKFKPCMLCGAKRFTVTTASRLVSLRLDAFIRQGFQCQGCGTLMNLTRRLDSDTWSVDPFGL